MNPKHVPTEWIDRTLEAIITAERITGQARSDHRFGWVSALHVLTEQIVDCRIDTVQTGSPYHTDYRYVAAAVLYLEALDLIAVTRAHGVESSRANSVESITLVYS